MNKSPASPTPDIAGLSIPELLDLLRRIADEIESREMEMAE